MTSRSLRFYITKEPPSQRTTKQTTEIEGRRNKSTYTQSGVSCIYEYEVLNLSPEFLMKLSANNPCLRVAAKR